VAYYKCIKSAVSEWCKVVGKLLGNLCTSRNWSTVRCKEGIC